MFHQHNGYGIVWETHGYDVYEGQCYGIPCDAGPFDTLDEARAWIDQQSAKQAA